jgi:hypothetical protein
MTDDMPYHKLSGSRRPPTGFAAWQATLGYISALYSPDAVLEISVKSLESRHVQWTAKVSWGQYEESVSDSDSLAYALRQLWVKVDQNHAIFTSSEDAARSPIDYDDHEWLDVLTQDILHRLIWTTRMVFLNDWTLIIVYQPTENPSMRIQMRLLAKDNSVHVGARGPGLLDTSRELYRNAAPVFWNNSERSGIGSVDDGS